MNKKTITWILVADGHRARVFANEGPGLGLKQALDQEFVHMLPPDRDLAADKAGSARSGGGASHHTLDHHENLHRHEKEVFARELAEKMDTYAAQHAFDRLIVIAPPQALGNLRAAFSKAVTAKLAGDLDKDLTHASLGDLQEHLAGMVEF